MDKFTNWLDKTLMPISTKLSENKYLSALQDGLMFSMPILIVGSICIIIGDFPLPVFQEAMSSLLGDIWGVLVLGYYGSCNYRIGFIAFNYWYS